MAWQEWTASLWADVLLQGHDDRVLMNRVQEEQLWADIIAEQPPSSAFALSSIPDWAGLCRSALGLAAAHRVTDRLRPLAETLDTRTYAAWLSTFRERCDRERLLPSALLDAELTEFAHQGVLPLGQGLHLVGFEQISASQEHLLDGMSSAASFVVQHALVNAGGEQHRQSIEVTDPPQQLRVAVGLIAAKASAASTPEPRFALICPNPEEHRDEVERLCREFLAPELNSVSADLSSTPWHFACQPPLISSAAVATALDVLRWMITPLPLERIAQLLNSPSLVFSGAGEARARFEVRPTWSVPALRGALSLSEFVASQARATSQPNGASLFPELWSLAEAIRSLSLDRVTRPAAEWTDQIRKLLRKVGWPGTRELSPAEFRIMEAWESLLDLVATLQVSGKKLSFTTVLELLSRQARTLPTPAPYVDAPLQILTLEQAEGLFFDFAIHLDATDDNLPAPESRHPFLPQSLQRTLGIGDSTHTLAEARHALQSLASRSGTLLLIAPQNGPKGESELTALADGLGFEQLDATAMPIPQDRCEVVDTEAIADPPSMPIPAPEEVGGGVDVLRLQAACGFRAFATHRLGADEAPPAGLGLDPRETGSLLHTALELLWQELGSRDALANRTPEERDNLVRQTVEKAFARRRLQAAPEDGWTTHYLKVLKRRFTFLITRWLELELKRSPFKVIAQETQQTLEVGPMRLKVRPDRIDEVDGGGRIFVDYKTSYDLSSNDWLDERPDAPQLPAYALSSDPQTLKGIAFAQIRPGKKMGWISLTERAGPFPPKGNKQVELADQLEHWRAELTSLAEAFSAGDARVNPKRYPHTCQYCAHRMLCRLDPTTLLEQADADEEDSVEEDALG